MARIKTRKDKELFEGKNSSNIRSATLLSGNYFDAADYLRQLAWAKNTSSHFSHSHFTFPAIIMFVTALEAFINELHEPLEQMYDPKCGDKIKSLIKKHRPDINIEECTWYQDILALLNLRNELIHYTPVIRNQGTAPDDIAEVMARSKITLSPILSYIGNLQNPAFADWASACVRRIGEEISKNLHPTDNFLMTEEERRAVLENSCHPARIAE